MHTSCYTSCCDPCSPSGSSPVPQPWNPFFDTEGDTMELSTLVVRKATYFQMGKVVWFNIYAFFTLALIPPALAGSPFVRFALPLAPKDIYSFGGSCMISNGVGFEAAPWVLDATSVYRVLVGAGGPNLWTEGTDRTIIGYGHYEIL